MKVDHASISPKGRESYNSSQAGGAGAAGKARSTKGAEKHESEKVLDKRESSNLSISERGREFARTKEAMKEAAASAPEVREDRIRELKHKINSGAYKVDADAVADRLVDDHIRTADFG